MKARRSRLGIIALLAVILVGAFLGGGVWLVVEFGKITLRIRDSEVRLAAVRHVCGLIGAYVERNGYTQWPRSWEDLLNGAEGGGQIGSWSPMEPRLRDLVIIDFGADLKMLRQQEAAEFTAVRPTSGVAAVSLVGDFQSLLERIRGPVRWPEPPSGSIDVSGQK